MENISNYYKKFVKVKQEKLEFVDVKLNDDNLLFIDPRFIETFPSRITKPMSDCLATFFGELLLAITSNKKRAEYLLSGVKEPRETRLGYGIKNSKGKSAGPILQDVLIQSIFKNPVIKENKIVSFNDISFFVHDIGPDIISDITTKIIKSHLIQFTQSQCKKYGIPTVEVNQTDIFNEQTISWDDKKVKLPVYKNHGINEPIIFVPKRIVNVKNDSKSSLGYFYRFARNYILDENDQQFLKGIPRNGKKNTIKKKDFDAAIRNKKEEMSKWVKQHPNILKDYWSESRDKIKVLSDDTIKKIVYSK